MDHVNDYEEFLLNIGELKANMFDDLMKIAAEDKKNNWSDEAIGADLANALYYYGRALELMKR